MKRKVPDTKIPKHEKDRLIGRREWERRNKNGNGGSCGSNAQMLVWSGTLCFGGAAYQPGAQWSSFGNDHGLCSHGQYSSFWSVQLSRESRGGGRRRSGALYAAHRGALDAWKPYGDHRRISRIEPELSVHMHLGWCDHCREPRCHQCYGPLGGTA